MSDEYRVRTLLSSSHPHWLGTRNALHFLIFTMNSKAEKIKRMYVMGFNPSLYSLNSRLRACLDSFQNGFSETKTKFYTIPPKHSKNLEKQFCIPNLIMNQNPESIFSYFSHPKRVPESHYPCQTISSTKITLDFPLDIITLLNTQKGFSYLFVVSFSLLFLFLEVHSALP